MPLSGNEKSARYRAKVNADPVARARYLEKRRESYQRRKREGKTNHIPVANLTKARQELVRQKWRQYKRSHRNRTRDLPLQSCSPDEMNCEWLQDFAPYSPGSEAESSSVRQESPVGNSSWIKQEPETTFVQWEDITSPPAATDPEQDNTPNSAISITLPVKEELPSSVMLTITKLQCLLENKQERIEALERQVQDLQEDRRFLRTQIETLNRALSVHLCQGNSYETTGNS